MKAFKISLKELIILILLSAPLGIFLFLNNEKKINYEVKAQRGFAVTENFCENYDFQKIYLLKDGEINVVAEKYISGQSSYTRLGRKIKVLINNDSDTYTISIKGVAGEEGAMAELTNKILESILESESLRFNYFYKTAKLHCKSGVFTIFKAVLLQKINNEFPATRSYKNSHLGFLLILPMSIIYLLFIALKYIRKISIKE